MNIKFKIVKFDKRLCFEVLEQKPLNADYTYLCKNGLKIIAHSPHIEHLGNKTVYIRGLGRGTQDFRYSTVGFSSNIERDRYYNLLIEGLKEFSENVKN